MSKNVSEYFVDNYRIRFDGDLVCFNDLHAAAGSPKNKKPNEFARLPDSIKLIDQLVKNMSIDKKKLYKPSKARSDRGGGTWGNFQIALQYCKYLALNSIYNVIADNFCERPKEFIIDTIRLEISFGDLIFDLLKNGRAIKNYNNGNGLQLIRQYKCIDYFIDFYLPEVNIAIEYDEEHHKHQQLDDIRRQFIIENELGCKFIRVKKGNEGSGIAMIYCEICFAIASDGDITYIDRAHEAVTKL